MAFRWYIVVISGPHNQDTYGSAAGMSLKESTRMMVAYSKALSEQLQLKVRNRSLLESEKRNRSEVSPLFLHYEYQNFCVSDIKSY